MKRRVIGAPIKRAPCKRCERWFTYAHKTKPRLYCRPCAAKVQKECVDASNRFQSEMRRKARLNAIEAHKAAEAACA